MSVDLSLIGPKGTQLYDVLPLIAALEEDQFLSTCESPFLLQVPLRDDDKPAASAPQPTPGAPDVTTVMSLEQMKTLKRSKQVREIVLHRLSARDGGSKIVLGRGEGCDVVLPEPSVSKQHAEMHVSLGNWMLKDLGSSNGTYINGKKVPAGESAAVEDRQNLWFSSYQCIFLLPENLFGLIQTITSKQQ